MHLKNGTINEVIACGRDITKPWQAGQMNEAELRLALKASEVGIWDWDLQTNQIIWTEQGRTLLGWSPATPSTYENFLATVHPEDLERVKQFYTHVIAGYPAYQMEYRVLLSDSSIHWLAERGCCFTDSQEYPTHILGAIIDITKLKQAEEQITAILESITEAFVHVDSAWQLTYVNQRAEAFYEKKREELLGKLLWDIMSGVLRTIIEQQLRDAMKRQQALHFEVKHLAKQRWLEIHVYPALGGLSIYFQDITTRKQMEESVRKSREELYSLTETMPQLVWTADPDGFLRYANQQWYDYTDSDLERLKGEGWIGYTHPDDRNKVQANWQTSLITSQLFQVEARLREGKTGKYRWFLLRAMPLMKPDGHVEKWFGTATDLHEKKSAEEALQESERRFRHLVESNIIGIMVVDQDGQIYEANDVFLYLIGHTRKQLAAGELQWKTIMLPKNLERDQQVVKEVLSTGKFQPFERDYVRTDGKSMRVLIGGTQLQRESSQGMYLCFVVDLTAHKELEQQKDLMLSMTSHELKTPLAALKGTLQLLERRKKRLQRKTDQLPPQIQAFFTDLSIQLATSVRLVDVQTSLIDDLLDLSRITTKTLKLERTHFDLVFLVRETVEDLRLTAPERSLVLEVLEDTMVNVLADRTRIGQVVTNYVTNALRYSPADQPIHIGLRLQENMAYVWVRDRGSGLSSEAQKEVWQRFHQINGIPMQSSGSGKGLGLGLYICQKLIAEHQGVVGVESIPGEGSTFWFMLPLTTD